MKPSLFHHHLHLESGDGWVRFSDVSQYFLNALRKMMVTRCFVSEILDTNSSTIICDKKSELRKPHYVPPVYGYNHQPSFHHHFTIMMVNPHTLIHPPLGGWR